MLPLESFLSLSICIAAVIGLVRLRKMDRTFYPFLILVWLASLNEILSDVLMLRGHGTMVNNNIYVLAEAVLFLWLFRNLGLFERSRLFFWVLLGASAAIWTWENFIHSNLHHLSSWFRIFYSSMIVLLSISLMNQLIISDVNKPLESSGMMLVKNPVFLICIGAIGYFTLKVLVEIFWLYGLTAGREFRIQVFHILMYVNLGANLIYAFAILWAAPKQPYMTIY